MNTNLGPDDDNGLTPKLWREMHRRFPTDAAPSIEFIRRQMLDAIKTAEVFSEVADPLDEARISGLCQMYEVFCAAARQAKSL